LDEADAVQLSSADRARASPGDNSSHCNEKQRQTFGKPIKEDFWVHIKALELHSSPSFCALILTPLIPQGQTDVAIRRVASKSQKGDLSMPLRRAAYAGRGKPLML
jgi:hypothetical protein